MIRLRPIWSAALLLAVLALPAAARADDWLSGEDATGTWGGARTALDEHGLHIDLDYVAETFVRDVEAIAYRGNLDLLVELDTAKANLWKGGTVLAYVQHDHGDGVSDELGLEMPASNYEGESFTQLSEFWLYQELPCRVALRLGKQDANRDFAAPRFGGNFLNSSYGVLPTTPLPSFPAPALGTAVFVQATDWLNLRGGVYEGAPQLESFAGHAFDDGAGVFAIGAVQIETGQGSARDARYQVGGWHHSGLGRSGGYASADLMMHLVPGATQARRSVQLFARVNWEPDANAPDAELYVGGGATAHGFVGANNTVGLGFGYVSVAGADQGFLELLFKWRPLAWFSVEPDVQVYFIGADTHVLLGLRCKIKL